MTIWSHEVGPEGAPLIVLVHGAMDRSAGMLKLSRQLDDEFRVLRYDRRGYGRSKPHPGPFTVDAHVDDLVALLAGRRALVVGHSFGGNVALATAERHPELVRAVAVYETPLSWLEWWPGSTGGGRGMDAVQGSPEEAAERFMRRMIGNRRWESLPERTREERRRRGADVRRGARRPGLERAVAGVLASRAPVVAMYGELGREHHRDGADYIADLLSDRDPIVIAGAGHNGPFTHPEPVAAVVRGPLDARQSPPPVQSDRMLGESWVATGGGQPARVVVVALSGVRIAGRPGIVTSWPKNVHVVSAVAPVVTVVVQLARTSSAQSVSSVALRPDEPGDRQQDGDGEHLRDHLLHEPHRGEREQDRAGDGVDAGVLRRVEFEGEHVGSGHGCTIFPGSPKSRDPPYAGGMASNAPWRTTDHAVPWRSPVDGAAGPPIPTPRRASRPPSPPTSRTASRRCRRWSPPTRATWLAGHARRPRRPHDRALRRLPRRLPPRARRPARQRVARLGLRALVGADEPGLPAGAARAAGDGGRDRRARRGRALRPVPHPARPDALT